jgi:hypothetical protein
MARRRKADGTIEEMKTGPVRLSASDPAEFDDDREPDDTRDMLNMHLKRTNITLDRNFERMERAVIRMTDTFDLQDKRHAETILRAADKHAQAQVDVADKMASARKAEARVIGILVGSLIFGVVILAGFNIQAKYGDTQLTTSTVGRQVSP